MYKLQFQTISNVLAQKMDPPLCTERFNKLKNSQTISEVLNPIQVEDHSP